MSISIKNVTKIYGTQKALDNVSFDVNKGEIVGFLGPNGAGKSTTMKILTCFIPQTEGEVSVCGLDVNNDAEKVKAKVGYLPEHNPLYLEMYVREYLEFIAGVHKLKNKKARVAEIIGAVGLSKESNKKISQLSKGYRQRVGLAQAMIHDPEVLILDEPTSGLDPNQLEDIRNLIKKFGENKTVLLSTHIMQEVEAICTRVIIINDGKIVADDEVSKLQKSPSKVQVVHVEFDSGANAQLLKSIEGVSKVESIGDQSFLIESRSNKDLRKSVAHFAQNEKLLILSLEEKKENLESVFKKLTK